MKWRVPVLTIIVPVYNAEKYLHKCINSILLQEFSDIEILLVNDGSTDSSRQICDEFALKDKRVKVFHKSNAGVSSARNYGINNAAGEWTTFVDSDDWLETNCYSFCNTLNEFSQIDLLIWGMQIKFDSGKNEIRKVPLSGEFKGKKIYEELVKCDISNLLESPTNKIFKTSIIKSYKLCFDEQISNLEDVDFVLRYVEKIKFLKIIDQFGYNYRKVNRSGSLSSTINHRVVDIVNTSINRRLSIFKFISPHLYVKYKTFLKEKKDKYLYFSLLSKYLTATKRSERFRSINFFFAESDYHSFVDSYVYYFVKLKMVYLMDFFLCLKYSLIKYK